jgi:glycosyltransferase involved in cell wall biosynthesis
MTSFVNEPDNAATMSISVIITAYNRRAYLLDAVSSVLNQTLGKSSFEIIVVKNFTDERIDDFLERNGVKSIFDAGDSIGDMLAAGLKHSIGEILCFLDDDDRFDTHKLEKVKLVFDSYDNLGYYHNAHKIFDQDVKNLSLREIPESKLIIEDSSEIARKYGYLSRCGIDFNLSSISVRKQIMRLVESRLHFLKQNTDSFTFYAAVSSGYALMMDNEILTYYRVHEGTSSRLLSDVNKMAFRRKFLSESIEMHALFESMTKNRAIRNIVRLNCTDFKIRFRLETGSKEIGLKALELLLFAALSLKYNQRYRILLLIWYLISPVFPHIASRMYERSRYSVTNRFDVGNA